MLYLKCVAVSTKASVRLVLGIIHFYNAPSLQQTHSHSQAAANVRHAIQIARDS